MILSKDFYFGDKDDGVGGMYYPPRYRLPKDYKAGDEISDGMFSPIPLKDFQDTHMDRLINRKVETGDFDGDNQGWSLQDDYEMSEEEIRNHPNKFKRGGSRPRPVERIPKMLLQNYEPQGWSMWDDERNIAAGEEFAGIDLSNPKFKQPIGGEEDTPLLDDMTDYEPNLPEILRVLLHEQAHRGTFEEIQRTMMDDSPEGSEYATWAHEFAANNLQYPGGTHDKDIPSDERMNARRDSFEHYPWRLKRGDSE
tara:strand:+ start:493 stop:1251 length:759 start_codon:yes stop_codon:yes gene_type:complete